jgi:hypothetical protein
MCRALDSSHEVLVELLVIIVNIYDRHRASGGGRSGRSRWHPAENGFEFPQLPAEELVVS